MSPPRAVLLVGEGNFSFSASMSHIYAEAGGSLTATCLQQQEEALRHEGAAGNIQIIQDSGGNVLFGVDCTKLEECTSLQGQRFDLIVFNFPHFGGKSFVKKNRDLLKNFFLSCVQVLADMGEVHVALCNGQGGTPADEPQRERHNSWQVVAMAAEADLVLSDVQPFGSERFPSYKCTGYRGRDKGFHVEKALVHAFTRSAPYVSAQSLTVEEAVGGEKVQYNIPAELSDYVFRDFLCSGSVHPVQLVQEFLLKGLSDHWSVSMLTQKTPFLITAQQLQTCPPDVDDTHTYWIHPVQREAGADIHFSVYKDKDDCVIWNSQGDTETRDAVSGADKVDRLRSKDADSSRSACSEGEDPEREKALYLLRPSLLPQMEELLNRKAGIQKETESKGEEIDGHNNNEVEEDGREEARVVCNGVTSSLYGLSDLVFRNVPVHLWTPPAYHELSLKGVFSVDCEPIRLLGESLETLLAPYGVCISTEDGGPVHLTAQLVGVVGEVFESNGSNNSSRSGVTVSLNLDLLAVLLFSLPDWRLLWSHDRRFSEQFGPHSPPGTPFRPFSLFPERFTFDICFWTGPSWEEWKFLALVREGGCGTVEQVKLLDRFSHPDLSQTSYCYRLVYHTHTHALSRTQALHFHKHLEALLSSRLQVTVR